MSDSANRSDQTQTFWYQLSLRIPAAELTHAESVLNALGALAVTVQDAGDQPLYEPAPGTQPSWDSNVVIGLFSAAQPMQTLLEQCHTELATATDFAVQRLDDQCWEQAWLDDFKPMQFGERLWIYPSHITPDPAAEIVLRLNPGLAFGSGTHATTALCLEWLQQQQLDGKTVLDYGCGSGVLGIAALKLGAKQVLATDIDPQALTATQWNAESNAVQQNIDILPSDELPNAQFDIVIANILSNTLIELAPRLSARLHPNGSLALSGILSAQAAAVRAAYRQHNIVFATQNKRSDWLLLAT